MQYDSPKPTKQTASLKDRVLKHPVTSLIGFALIVVSTYGLYHGLEGAFCTLMLISGLTSIGLKDPRI